MAQMLRRTIRLYYYAGSERTPAKTSLLQPAETFAAGGAVSPRVAALAAAGMPASGTADFVVGPELPEVSSTQAREALARRDRDGADDGPCLGDQA